VFAALAVAQALRARHPSASILLVGRTGGIEEQVVPAAGFDLETIPVRGLNRDTLWPNLRLPDVLPRALGRGLRVVDRFRPDVVLGVGAYAMVPCGWAALRRGVPCVLQVSEPDGLAHRMLRSGAAAACLTSADDVPAFPVRRAVVTGYPIRSGFGRRSPHVPPRRLLVIGGSLGARRVNETVWAALDRLLQRFEEVVHMTGAQGAREGARRARPGYRAISTNTDVPRLMREADVVLCRAGSGTCAEVTAVGLPAIVVPGTFGGGHQERNAERLVRAGAATRIPDRELSAERLLAHLRGLDPARLRSMARMSAATGRFDAAERIVDVLEETVAGSAGIPLNRVQAGASVLRGLLRP
jgi:UDP-N-acetylglucosamine--N-acetylmuramyl-(pentapeptide) pyrophosphoryl-undecaprenol N-acetylglucosamine transferase